MRAPLRMKHASGDRNRKTARIQAARGERLHIRRIGPKPIPPCSPSRLVALSRCPDAMCILRGLAARENGTKVLNVINRGRCETTGAKDFLPEMRPGRTP